MDMELTNLLGVFVFLSGGFVFVSLRKHLLSMLLSLEFMVLSMFMLLMVLLSGYNCEFYFVLIFLTFTVCEGVLGLSILVSMVRLHGNDYFQSFNIL